MHLNIGIGCALMVVTTFIHAAAMVLVFRALKIMHAERRLSRAGWRRAWTVAGLVLVMFLATVVEASVWAATYLLVGAISGLEQALYFSMVTYTTLGYGDVVLNEGWRLLSSFEAANGIIMFGWTTALIVAAVHRMYVVVAADQATTDADREQAG